MPSYAKKKNKSLFIGENTEGPTYAKKKGGSVR